MDQESSQREIAEIALRKLFIGNIEIWQEILEAPIRFNISGTWELSGLKDCLNYLIEETGDGKPIDPFKKTDGTAWVLVSQADE